MPRYFFDVLDEYQTYFDELGLDLADREAALLYAKRLVRELREHGYDDPRLVMIVKDEKGGVLFSLPFVAGH